MAFRLSVLLVGYAVVVCAALICSCVFFSVRLSTSATENALQISKMAMARYVSRSMLLLDGLQLTSSRVGFTLMKTAALASSVAMDAPLHLLDHAFQVLRPINRASSLVSQEEVWWSEEEQAFMSVGCYRHNATCFRTNGNTTTYVSSVFPYSAFLYGEAWTADAPSQYFSLHERMLRQPQFTGIHGLWTPQIARFTVRTDRIPCGDRHMEYVMLYYDCMAYRSEGDLPSFPLDAELPHRDGYCTHAIVSVVALMDRPFYMQSGLTPESIVRVQSLLVLDEVKNATCTQKSDSAVAAFEPIAKHADGAGGSEAGLWLSSAVAGDMLVTRALLMRENGLLIAFQESTPKKLLLATARADNIVSGVITTIVVVFVMVITSVMCYAVSWPLQQVCRSMRRATLGIVESEEDELQEEAVSSRRGLLPRRKPRGNVLVKEVVDLYETYKSLRLALSELKAFAPQGLFVMESAATAAAAQSGSVGAIQELSNVSVSSWETADGRPGPSDTVSAPVPASDSTSERDCSLEMTGSRSTRRRQPADTRVCTAASSAVTAAASTRDAQCSPRVLSSPVPPLLLPQLRALPHLPSTPPLSPTTTVVSGGAARLDFPALKRATFFRMVHCTTLTISCHYALANLELATSEVQHFMHTCIDLILSHSGTVEVFRPEVLVAAFGAHREDALHTKRALQCAVRIFARFTPDQQKRVSLLLDTGNIYVGTCGAYGRYARVIAGDRLDFVLRARLHDLSAGRIITTDSVALTQHTRKCIFIPFDNIVARGSTGLQKGSTVLFQLVLKDTMPHSLSSFASAYNEAFMHAVNGNYEIALGQLAVLPVRDATMQAAFTGALRTILSVSPRRPRYCRFELPPFETLGFTVAPMSPAQLYKPLLMHDLEPRVPHVHFLSVGEQVLDPATSLNTTAVASALHPTGEGHAEVAPSLPSAATGRGMRSGGGAASCASLDGTHMSGAAENYSCGDPTPQTFRDSRGEQWTLVPDCIGRGAFSEVFKAFSSDGVIMAVKCIQLARRNVQMSDVVEEVNTSCQLWSEFIVNCTSWAHVGSYLFIVMELLAGGSLHNTIRHFPRGLNDALARRYASDALRGLTYLHRNGIVHADVKPQNMLLATDGGCRISDFGSSVTKSNAMLGLPGDVYQLRGTPLYMSPEVARGGPPTAKSDVWSFGLSLFEVLTGQLPWVWRSSGLLALSSVDTQHTGTDPASRRDFVCQSPQEQSTSSLLQPFTRVSPSSDLSRPLPPMLGRSCDPNEGRHTPLRTSAQRTPSPPSLAIGRGSLNKPVPTLPQLGTLSSSTFLQGVIRGDIVVRTDAAAVLSTEARRVVEACLRTRPEERPTVEELLFMPYFYS